MTRGFCWLVFFVLVFSLPTGARAHLDMTSPVSRYGPNVLKTGPCGVAGGERSANINYFEPGQTIEVEWDEYTDHPSHYRISFDEDGDDDFVDPATMQEYYSNDAVLLDNIKDEPPTDPLYRVSVTLPDVECDNCTLQVIQVMYDKRPYVVPGNDIYYQCADLVLTRGGAPDAGTGADAGTGTDADAGTDTDAGAVPDAGPRAGPDTGTGSGCRASRGNTGSLGLVLWLLSLIVIRRLARGAEFPV
ncbi:MAG: lytic polysaccharide monooxygenase [Myxococcales bacterium]|nr:lytic polysaccharide monooxygenase [Myxococcales bacterium]MDH3483271.1 lytic polysaccharide monooxygenase [Myxococcales bacterium]